MAATACAPVTSWSASIARSGRLRIYEGASDVQRVVIARAVLAGPIGARDLPSDAMRTP